MKRGFFVCLILFSLSAFPQNDKETIKKIFDTCMTESNSYQMLDYLSNEIGGRLSGSLSADRAVEWSYSELQKIGFDNEWLQEVMVPKWVRGPKEFALIETEPGVTFDVDVCALGGSVATPSVGIKSNVIEVSALEDLKKLGKKNIDGKIVFLSKYNNYEEKNSVFLIKYKSELVSIANLTKGYIIPRRNFNL